MAKEKARMGNADQTGLFHGAKVAQALKAIAPNVSRHLEYVSDGVISVKILYRGDNDWLVVAKRYSETNQVDVCFGSGRDWTGAVIGLDIAMEHDKWRPDKWANE